MAISAAMSETREDRTDDILINTGSCNFNRKTVVVGAAVDDAAMGDDNKDGHENDVLMPGFRFHPTEEELIEFYLRRKVEGKRFNVNLITFLDLYRYDPWELPALATIGEKEWFFYVPRDRKYRNGDRPNRVTTSGYWKATGADRTIRSDQSSRSIGLKKTLVFYSGKAPKGTRTGWIMNEYRLPQAEPDQYHKAEISLCRVYKRASDHSHLLPATLSSKPSSSKNPTPSKNNHNALTGNSTTEEIHGTARVDGNSTGSSVDMSSIIYSASTVNPITNTVGATVMEEEVGSILNNPKGANDMVLTTLDELNRIVGYNQRSSNDNHNNINDNNEQIHILSTLPSMSLQPQLVPLPVISDKLWDWSSLPEGGSDFK